MRALQAAVLVMGVLIVAGFGVVVVTVVHRLGSSGGAYSAASAAPAASVILDEPAGTRIAATSTAADRLALTLAGGGPDRVVVLDTRSGRVIARASLAR